MIVYESTKNEFINDVFNDELVNNICRNYNAKIGKINENEVRSWDNSMQYMYRVLSDRDIPEDAGIAIEFNIPHTSRRVDLLISGKKEDRDSIIIVELKQWEKVEAIYGKEAIVKTRFQHGPTETTHPSYQAWSYSALIKDYNENAQQGNMDLYPCAYLHNYINQGDQDQLTDQVYDYYIDQAPVFVKGEAAKLRDFIKRNIQVGDQKENLYQIEKGKIRPSKSLQDSLNSMLQGNEEFIMIDDQKVVYEQAISLAQTALRTNNKQVLIVQGGPGTGKSVLAINLLVELTKQSMVTQYVTKNAAPRNVYARKLKQDFRKGHIDNLFKSSGIFVDAPKDERDALIVDESHRLNEKSGLFQNKGENQTKEIIQASKLSVFFIDERQRVTLKDKGTMSDIRNFAEELGADLSIMQLDSQFRCSGSDGYLAWLDDVLEIRETANANEIGSQYDFRVFDDPLVLKKEIERLNDANNKSRMVAGYCWDWVKQGKNDPNHFDVVLEEYDFKMSWNLGDTETWAIDESSISEIGCIHTSQGLEFDYVGVIIGNDMRYDNGEILTDHTKRAKTDTSLRGIKKMMKEDPERAEILADEIIKNTYRTLMTRGQKGCFVYCTDSTLANYLKNRYEQVSKRFEENDLFSNSSQRVAEDDGDYRTH
ncbi:DNA/RNA helicase domain-containing protein [Halobacillus seohaensis]|uniref:DNA/RNA helicase domain-containing protein n=1 Tax=Halobacillus seohaensis TaxID=447421 RepID=A0ABW2EPM9_9BACI